MRLIFERYEEHSPPRWASFGLHVEFSKGRLDAFSRLRWRLYLRWTFLRSAGSYSLIFGTREAQ